MFLDELNTEKAYLMKLSEKASIDILDAPDGKLRTTRNGTSPVYYYRKTPSDRIGEYIPASNRALAQALAQKEYSEKILSCTEERLYHIDALIADYEKNNLINLPNTYSKGKRRLISPYILNDNEFKNAWLNKPYTPNPDHPENLIFETAQGLKVRSKSEQIIAENFTRLNIPFKYEMPIYYATGKAIYPDFTILNVHSRTVVYYEHFGRMAEEAYLNHFFWKLKIYDSLGLLPGKNLLFTFEDKNHPFDFATHKHLFETFVIR